MKKQIYLTTLAALGLLTIPSTSLAASFSSSTESEFTQLQESGLFTELFVAEARIGNNGPSGDREIGINNASGAPVAQGQRVYESGVAVPFTLAYSQDDGVTYELGGQTLTSAQFGGEANTIFLRSRSQGSSSSVLTIDGISGAELSTSGDDVDYGVISDISAPIELTGSLTFSDFEDVGRSQLASQFKVGFSSQGQVGAVPEPLTILGTGTALGFGVLFKKRASQRKQNKG